MVAASQVSHVERSLQSLENRVMLVWQVILREIVYMLHTGKKSVLYAAQKKTTVIIAM